MQVKKGRLMSEYLGENDHDKKNQLNGVPTVEGLNPENVAKGQCIDFDPDKKKGKQLIEG